MVRAEQIPSKKQLSAWVENIIHLNFDRYSSHLYSQSDSSALKVTPVAPVYAEEVKMEDGRIVLRENYRKILEKHPEVLVYGEDAGKIGGVNQTLEGLQEQFGEMRVFDTGIRECTIVGQGIGMALRGLRPIAEIQYLDYLLYAIQIISDDLATLQYRTKGGQKAPLIISTRGHRLEGIWHSGSPMGMILHALRGMHVLVPRNMTQAAGFYNTMLKSDEPALIIECLNGYRIKEQLPDNIGEYTLPIGVTETLQEGSDLTIVSYGSTLRVVQDAMLLLNDVGISCELIDAQSLLPFDIHHDCVKSLIKTNKLVVIDEDVPGGASSYILQQILEVQNGYMHLDAKPVTIAAKAHRPAYGTDGDYFSKPNAEEIYDAIYTMMHEYDPQRFS
jgi:pyruvate/2-oxoglutarate/acetoin dehydrogenase E1 component